MKNNKSFNKILELTETALATPEIKKDKNLCEILEKIKDSAAKGEISVITEEILGLLK